MQATIDEYLRMKGLLYDKYHGQSKRYNWKKVCFFMEKSLKLS